MERRTAGASSPTRMRTTTEPIAGLRPGTAPGLVPLRQLGQVVVVGGHLLVLLFLLGRLLGSGRGSSCGTIRTAGIGADGRGRRRLLGRLVHEAPPHVDGVTREEGPLEDIGPTEGVAAQGAA